MTKDSRKAHCSFFHCQEEKNSFEVKSFASKRYAFVMISLQFMYIHM